MRLNRQALGARPLLCSGVALAALAMVAVRGRWSRNVRRVDSPDRNVMIRFASVDTLPEGQDSEAGLVRSKGSAVPKADAQNTPEDQTP